MIEITVSGSGCWEVNVRADLVCRTCSKNETKEIHIPVESRDEFRRCKNLEVSLEGVPSRAGQVFISYSHKDVRWLERLQVHLKPLERLGAIKKWDDTIIKPGADWREEIQRGLVNGCCIAGFLLFGMQNCTEMRLKTHST